VSQSTDLALREDLIKSVRVLSLLVREDYPDTLSLQECAATWTLCSLEDAEALGRVEARYLAKNSSSVSSSRFDK
jgi:hypothetical protein